MRVLLVILVLLDKRSLYISGRMLIARMRVGQGCTFRQNSLIGFLAHGLLDSQL